MSKRKKKVPFTTILSGAAGTNEGHHCPPEAYTICTEVFSFSQAFNGPSGSQLFF
jgi:hypothetical protein